MPPPIERKLAAIMFTDIAGYTALSAKDSTKSSELLKTQRDTLKPIVEKHGGSWMKEIGDGLLITFDSATSAVECSIAIQETTKDIEDLNLRIGIHEGEVIKQDGDVIGDDVNVASRIEPFSAVGGVAISHKIQQAISSNTEFETKYIGKPKLKGVAQEVKVYCITSHGLPETDVSKVSAKLEEEEVKPRFNIFSLTGGVLTAIGVAFWIAVGVFDVSFGGKVEVPSVGILMMENLGKEEEEFWSSGMTADLITKVAGAGLIRVAPLDDILKLDKDLSIEEKAKKLRVKYILTHSFLIKDDGFDLWCKLENTENGVALFSNKISEPMAMTTQMVGKLANDIITSLKVKTVQDMMKASTNNAEAYELYLLGKYKISHRENIQDKKIAKELLEKAIELDDNLLVAKLLLGIFVEEQTEEYYISILKQAEAIGDKKAIAYCLSSIGLYYTYDKGQFDKAIEYGNQAVKVHEEIDNFSGIADAYYHLGLTYLHKQDEKSSLFSLKQARNNYKKISFDDYHTINLIATIYSMQGELQKSLDYYLNAYQMVQEMIDVPKLTSAMLLGNIGSVYLFMGDFANASMYLNRSLKLCEEIGEPHQIAALLHDIGILNIYRSNYSQAAIHLERTLSLSKGELYGDLEATTHLYLAYKHLGKEFDINKIYMLIKDAENIEFELNLRLYELLEDKPYLETAYNQIEEKTDNLEPDVAAKFLSYPIPKAIVEEWEKVK
jgi:class 3 adenylate cyclase/tetratricopeptide (TPR) repeat protein